MPGGATARTCGLPRDRQGFCSSFMMNTRNCRGLEIIAIFLKRRGGMPN